MNKIVLFISSSVLAIISFVSMSAYAESHEIAEIECITQAALSEMTDEAKANQTLSLCIGDEGEDQGQDEDDKPAKVE